MATLKWWNAIANRWEPLPLTPSHEVHVGPSVPEFNQVMWADPDEPEPRTLLDAFELVGPWYQYVTRLLPWKADVLVVWSATCYTPVLGGNNGCALAVDGVAKDHANYYFNEANSHKLVESRVVLRGMVPGNHTWGIYKEFYATSDGGDLAHISLVAEPV